MKIRPVITITFFLLLTSAAFYSCQKELKEKINDPSSTDAKSFSSSLRVWHGTRVQGNVPAPHGSLLQLDDSNKEPVRAFAGRYAVLQPKLTSGNSVDGYYLKVNGASEYFKVDYTKPRAINGRQIGSHHHNSVVAHMDSPTDGNLDSSIVIVLPPNLPVPDSFCVSYYAYDNSGNVSNPVSVCIIVTDSGTDANGKWLMGNWKLTAAWEDNEPHDTIVYNRWIRDSDKDSYYCNNGTLAWAGASGQTLLATDSVYYRKANLNFVSNGEQKYDFDDSWKSVNIMASTCSDIVFNPQQNEAETISGAWSYNSTTNKMVLVFEFDKTGTAVEQASEYDVLKISNNEFVLRATLAEDSSKPPYLYHMRFEK